MLAPDLLGHGRSSWAAPWTIDANVAALAALLEAEAAGPVVVVGHSFGGAVALRLAAARPDLVDGLVLLDPAVGLDGDWMREIADAMLASPDYPDRDEARAEKVNGSWGEVDDDELERELDEHLIALPNGRVGWRISIPAIMSYWSELARPVAAAARAAPRRRWSARPAPSPPTSPTNWSRRLRAALGIGLHAARLRLRSHGAAGQTRRDGAADPRTCWAERWPRSPTSRWRRCARWSPRSRRAGSRPTATSPRPQGFPARASSAGSCAPTPRICRGTG